MCHMPSMLNPNWVARTGSGAAGSWLVRNIVVVAVRSSEGAMRLRGVTGHGRQHWWVSEQAPCHKELQGKVAGAVVLEVGYDI